MKKLTPADPETKSPDIKAENLAALQALFPELATEGPDGVAVNLDVLKQLVGDQTVTDAEEKYGLNWHGKRRARQLALTPSTGTLRPCPEDSVDWDTTQNLMIEGDNLEVLKLLQKSYAGKVKLIYIDPPYNTGKDFVYPDNFQDSIKNYLELTGQTGEGGRKLSSNTEASGRFHTDWLNMMYPRLKLARNLLREDGLILVSIDDHESGNLRELCDEIFGGDNFAVQMVWKKGGTGKNDSRHAVVEHEYVLAYARNLGESSFCLDPEASVSTSYNRKDEQGQYSLVRLDSKTLGYVPSLDFEIVSPEGISYRPEQPADRVAVARWRWGKEKVRAEVAALVFEKGFVYTKNYEKEGARPRSLMVDERFGVTRTGRAEAELALGQTGVFDFPKPVRLIRHLVRVGGDSEAIVLDFFAGSGTTAQAVWEENVSDGGSRQCIQVQFPEPLDPDNRDQKTAADFCDMLKKPRNIAELTKERLRRAGKKIREENPMFAGDLGFRVFKLASSNIRAWEPDRDKLAETLEASIEHLKTDRTEQDILFELLLKLGLDLCVPIERKKVEGAKKQAHEIHSIGGGSLLVCLSPAIPQADVEPLALGLVAWHQALKPAGETTVVFRDSAFADDVAKTNLTAILHQHGLETVRSL